MKQQDLVAATANSLKSALHSAEVQMTILNQLLKKGTATSNADTDEDEEDEAEFTPKKKAKSFDEDEEESEDEAEETEAASDDEDEDEDASFDAAEDDAPKGKAAKKKAKSFDDEDEDEEEAKPAKKTKAVKISLDDVVDAFKVRVSAEIKKRGIPAPEARKFVQKLLVKKFGVKSVTDLETTDYAAAIKLAESAK